MSLKHLILLGAVFVTMVIAEEGKEEVKTEEVKEQGEEKINDAGFNDDVFNKLLESPEMQEMLKNNDFQGMMDYLMKNNALDGMDMGHDHEHDGHDHDGHDHEGHESNEEKFSESESISETRSDL